MVAPDAEYKFGNATVRIHGKVNNERIKEAAIAFLKKVEKSKKRGSKDGNGTTR